MCESSDVIAYSTFYVCLRASVRTYICICMSFKCVYAEAFFSPDEKTDK